jgi:hypothetical protein
MASRPRSVIRGARFFLAHAPGLVRHGSKPSRDIAVTAGVEIDRALRPWGRSRPGEPKGWRAPSGPLWDCRGRDRASHREPARAAWRDRARRSHGLLKIGDQFDSCSSKRISERARGAARIR